MYLFLVPTSVVWLVSPYASPTSKSNSVIVLVLCVISHVHMCIVPVCICIFETEMPHSGFNWIYVFCCLLQVPIYIVHLHVHVGTCTCTSRFLCTTCTLFLQIWQVSSRKCIHTLSHSCAVLSCDFSPNQERLVTGNTDGVISVSSLI